MAHVLGDCSKEGGLLVLVSERKIGRTYVRHSRVYWSQVRIADTPGWPPEAGVQRP